jgi:hypothetical protein
MVTALINKGKKLRGGRGTLCWDWRMEIVVDRGDPKTVKGAAAQQQQHIYQPRQKITLKMNYNQSENKKEVVPSVVAETNCCFQPDVSLFSFNLHFGCEARHVGYSAGYIIL